MTLAHVRDILRHECVLLYRRVRGVSERVADLHQVVTHAQTVRGVVLVEDVVAHDAALRPRRSASVGHAQSLLHGVHVVEGVDGL